MDYARGAYCCTAIKINTLLGLIPSFCENNDWLSSHFNSSLGKLLFNNGYYDSSRGIFIDKFDPTIVFFHKIHLDFKEFDADYMSDIRKRLFYNPLGKEVGDYFIHVLARGLMGDKMKKIIFGLGATDCGKSTVTTAFSKACGEYVGTFNASALSIREVQDEAQSMRWALLLATKRLIFSNELSSTKALDGTCLKKHSGGDEIIGRTHGGEETPFEPHYLMFCLGNDMPDIKPYDDAIDGRVDCFEYKKQFVDEPTGDQLKKDPNLKAEMDTPEFKLNFLALFIQSYALKENLLKPEACLNAKKDWVSQNIGCIPAFLETFDINNLAYDSKVPDDTSLPASDVAKWLKDSKLEISIKKVGLELKAYCKKNGYENVESKVISVNGKKYQAWIGIRWA
jgi:hypothetical protein